MKRATYHPDKHLALWRSLCKDRNWLDQYCSGPDWGLSLCEAFQYDGELICYTTDDEKNMAVFWERSVEGGRMYFPADSMWLLGNPLLGENPAQLLRGLLQFWSKAPLENGLRQILISGLYPNHPLLRVRFWERLRGWEIDSSERMVASLEGGFDGFMSRRSKNFRSRLRRTVKKAKAMGVEVEFAPEIMSEGSSRRFLERVFAVEEESWKGQAGRGINDGSMQEFYLRMIPRLAAEGNFRGLFLSQEGKDVAYLFGGVFNDYFRGLQFSFRDEHQIGLGNVCQYHAIKRLCEQGLRAYDLGQGMAYKKRWSEQHVTSRSFFFQMP